MIKCFKENDKLKEEKHLKKKCWEKQNGKQVFFFPQIYSRVAELQICSVSFSTYTNFLTNSKKLEEQFVLWKQCCFKEQQ